MKIYNAIFEGYEGTEQDAISYGAALIPCEVETTEQTKPAYSDHITSLDSIAIKCSDYTAVIMPIKAD